MVHLIACVGVHSSRYITITFFFLGCFSYIRGTTYPILGHREPEESIPGDTLDKDPPYHMAKSNPHSHTADYLGMPI